MRIQRMLGPSAVICCGLCALLAGSTGPDDRPLTDPESVVSTSNPASRPVPSTTSTTQIAFTSDISGRSNLWKVRASGGWPIQLTQSDDRQYSAVWSPNGRWIVYQYDIACSTGAPARSIG